MQKPALGTESSSVSTEEKSSGDYLDRLMRRASFAALWPLFAKATKPAKELTESFSALVHLRPFILANEPCRVIHVGDGAHARTAAMFALKTQAENISVDPIINTQIVSEWKQTYRVERFDWRAARIEDVAEELNALPRMRVLVTFVHAHVNTDRTLELLRWDAAFCLACCVPGIQLTQSRALQSAGRDLQVLSADRQFEVYTKE